MKSVFDYKINVYDAYDMQKFLKNGKYMCIYESPDGIFYWVNAHAYVIKVKKNGTHEFMWRYITQNNARTIRVEQKIMKLDRLVAENFLALPEQDGKYYELEHIDGNAKNNDVSNLRWRARGERISAYKQEHKMDILLKKLSKLGNIDEDDDVIIMNLED